jgi:hypothetical protein
MRRFHNPGVPLPRANEGMPYPFDRPDFRNRPDLAGYWFLPAWYTVTINLGHHAGDTARGSVQLRPETFVMYRIGWATTGDTPPWEETESGTPSKQGRSVQVSFSDEYTQFVTQPTLISAIFGDSCGFLDIPQAVQLRGKQSITVEITRVQYPGTPPEQEADFTRFDFCFMGVGLLKPGQPVSGTVG